MKVCPKCNSSYTDETLNFCLTDGVPLVVEEVLDEYLSRESSWHKAETLLDPRFSAPPEARATSVNPSSPTLELGTNTSGSISLERSNKNLFAALGLAAALIFAAGLYFWTAKNPATAVNNVAVNTSPPAVDNRPTVPKREIVALSPQEDAQVRKELAAFIQSWVKSNSAKDADAHIAHYASTLEIYYDENGKDRNHVLADRLRAYKRYDSIQMQADNLKITPESPESATLVFDKSWTMKNAQKTSTGSVQQEMHVSKHEGRWLIDSERDLKVYFINNRENQPSENANQTTGASAN